MILYYTGGRWPLIPNSFLCGNVQENSSHILYSYMPTFIEMEGQDNSCCFTRIMLTWHKSSTFFFLQKISAEITPIGRRRILFEFGNKCFIHSISGMMKRETCQKKKGDRPMEKLFLPFLARFLNFLTLWKTTLESGGKKPAIKTKTISRLLYRVFLNRKTSLN